MMTNKNFITLHSDGESRAINPSRIDYIEFRRATGKKRSAAIILFQSGETITMKGTWAEMLQEELDGPPYTNISSELLRMKNDQPSFCLKSAALRVTATSYRLRGAFQILRKDD